MQGSKSGSYIPRWAALGAAILVAGVAGSARAQTPTRGITDREVLFGMSAAFSGTAKELGHNMKVGFDVAFAAANAAGGVNGRKLSLVALDDNNEPTKAQAAVKDLIEKRNVFALVGNVGSAAIEAYLPYLLDKQVMLFGAMSGAGFLRNDPPDRYVFNYRASYAEETAAAVRWLVEVKRIRPSEIAFFGQEDGYGESGWKGFSQVMRRYRRDPARAVRTGFKRNTVDVDDAVKKIRQGAREKKIKAVVMVATHRPAAKFIEKVHDFGLLFTNTSAVEAHELADDLHQLGGQFADGVVVTQVVPLPSGRSSAIIKYQEQLKKFAPGERPDFLSLQAWVSGQILVEGLKRAGRNLTADSLVESLESIRGMDLGIGVPISFGPSEHQASHKVWGTVLDGAGALKPLDLE
jgi:ABC-type branched-subunit amino acid transport system substrate-binding protein